ncbi:MAG: acyltransferase family protein [Bacteroidota bacterium]
MSKNPKARTYFPNLDASRFLAFIPVFFTHVFFSNNPKVIHSGAYLFVQNHLQLGLLGLDYFFVLSGFLITWIILEEAARRGTFSLYHFYVRRSLRIFPLYFAVVLSGFFLVFLLQLLPGQSPSELPSFFYFLTFTLNFYKK